MNKRVTIEMPDEIHRLIAEHAAKAGAATDAYVLEVIEQHLEDLHDIAAADAVMERLERGEDRIVSAEEFWRGLDD
jgi:RHH-type transcriptional regulator, rel operon repressor / antitoxin RelB